VAGDQNSGEREVDPRTENAGASERLLASKNFGGIAESQEAARQWAQKFLFYLIAGCLLFLAMFDSALLLPAAHLEMKVIATVNGAFAGGSGVLGLCASYILAPYRNSRARGNSPRNK
jgi:hypothetical protein